MYRHYLEKLTRTRLDDVLVDEGVLDRPRLEAAQAEQDQAGSLLSDVLIDSNTIDEWDLAKLVAAHYTLPFIDVKLYQIPGPIMELLPLDWCRAHSVLPIDQFGKGLGLVCVEVPTPEVIEEITSATGCSPFIYVGVRRALREVIDEAVKRRGGRTAPAKAIQGAAPAVQAGASPRRSLTSHVPEDALPVLDLPHISLKLNASAAQLIAESGAAVKRPPLERFGRPVPAPPASLTAPPAKRVSSSGSRTSDKGPPPAPAPQFEPPPARAPAAPVPVASRPSAPTAPAPAPKTGDPVRPVLTTRVAPQLPQPAAKKPAPAPQQTGWESIFDSGDSAVRRPDDPSGRK